MKNTTSIDEFVSDVMKKIKDEVYAAYYYGKQPQKSAKKLDAHPSTVVNYRRDHRLVHGRYSITREKRKKAQ